MVETYENTIQFYNSDTNWSNTDLSWPKVEHLMLSELMAAFYSIPLGKPLKVKRKLKQTYLWNENDQSRNI